MFCQCFDIPGSISLQQLSRYEDVNKPNVTLAQEQNQLLELMGKNNITYHSIPMNAQTISNRRCRALFKYGGIVARQYRSMCNSPRARMNL